MSTNVSFNYAPLKSFSCKAILINAEQKGFKYVTLNTNAKQQLPWKMIIAFYFMFDEQGKANFFRLKKIIFQCMETIKKTPT